MGYKKQEIKQGIEVHIINTDRFKTNLIAVFLTTPITRENVTFDAVLTSTLRRGSKNMPSQEQISKELEEMYGASFDCGIDKTGDNHVFKFYLESINDRFLPQENENMLKNSIEKLLDIVFNPLVENAKFNDKYVNQEKNNIQRKIESKIDNKAKYAVERCIEEMYKNETYGLYKFGYVEDLEKIDSTNLYKYYQELIKNCKIDIFISGKLYEKLEGVLNDEERIIHILKTNPNIEKLNAREAKYILTEIVPKENIGQPKNVTESMEVTQGKLILGLDVNLENDREKYITSVYNAILGGSANSKLFQEVREKASLAYTVSSNFIRHKGNIIISSGIEIKNYAKALEIIERQLKDMKQGNFTDEELINSKKGIISAIKGIEDEQDTEVTYYFGQELSNAATSIDNYIKTIESVTRDEVTDIANKININTIYFLKN